MIQKRKRNQSSGIVKFLVYSSVRDGMEEVIERGLRVGGNIGFVQPGAT